MSRILLEICVEDAEGLAAAVAAGADRIELCQALDQGGLTPSPGFMRHAAAAGVAVLALIRPRAGDFAYSDTDLDICLDDIEAARRAGLAGVVIGAARQDGALDAAAMGRLCAAAKGLEVVLHRVIDTVPDRVAALETAAGLGVARILTSGGAASAAEGASEIARLAAQAAGRIEIMPGAGITASNVARVLGLRGLVSVHASCRTNAAGGDDPHHFGTNRRRTDAEAIRALRRAIDEFAAAGA
jgi:copper homeostasis protein